MIYISYLIQIISEFFPISSTLFLKSLNLMDVGIFHIFSGLLLIIIFYKKILTLVMSPYKNFKTILNYFLINLPSVILGIIINFTFFLNFNITYKFQLIINIIMGLVLYMVTKRFENNYRNFSLLKEINISDSICLGIFLSLNGIFPGMSRLGTSLIFLLLRGYPLKKSYELSLITSIPVIIGKPLVLLIKDADTRFYFYNFCQEYYILIILSFILGFFFYKIINYYLSVNNLKFFSFLRILFFIFILISILI